MRVQGPRPENILFLVNEVIEALISESFRGVHYDFLLPCTDCIKAVSNTHIYILSFIYSRYFLIVNQSIIRNQSIINLCCFCLSFDVFFSFNVFNFIILYSNAVTHLGFNKGILRI